MVKFEVIEYYNIYSHFSNFTPYRCEEIRKTFWQSNLKKFWAYHYHSIFLLFSLGVLNTCSLQYPRNVYKNYVIRNVVITSCFENVNASGCDLSNLNVSASVKSFGIRSYVTSISYKSTIRFDTTSLGKFQNAVVGSSLFSIVAHDGETGIANTSLMTTLKKLVRITRVCLNETHMISLLLVEKELFL